MDHAADRGGGSAACGHHAAATPRPTTKAARTWCSQCSARPADERVSRLQIAASAPRSHAPLAISNWVIEFARVVERLRDCARPTQLFHVQSHAGMPWSRQFFIRPQADCPGFYYQTARTAQETRKKIAALNAALTELIRGSCGFSSASLI